MAKMNQLIGYVDSPKQFDFSMLRTLHDLIHGRQSHEGYVEHFKPKGKERVYFSGAIVPGPNMRETRATIWKLCDQAIAKGFICWFVLSDGVDEISYGNEPSPLKKTIKYEIDHLEAEVIV